jgi:hypothetical protein
VSRENVSLDKKKSADVPPRENEVCTLSKRVICKANVSKKESIEKQRNKPREVEEGPKSRESTRLRREKSEERGKRERRERRMGENSGLEASK